MACKSTCSQVSVVLPGSASQVGGNSKHRKTLEIIFSKPAPTSLEAKPYQVADARTFLQLIGVTP